MALREADARMPDEAGGTQPAGRAARRAAAEPPPTVVGRPDEELLAEFVAGRRAGLAELARRYERPLLGLACGMLGGRRDLACDAVQQTWLRVIRFGHTFAGRSGLKTWLYRIAINECRSLAALEARAAEIASEAGASVAAGAPAAGKGTFVPDTSSRLDIEERSDALRRAVGQLDADQQSVILLCYHAGMTHPQAAEILEIPLGTLKSRLHAALEELRTRLSPS